MTMDDKFDGFSFLLGIATGYGLCLILLGVW